MLPFSPFCPSRRRLASRLGLSIARHAFDKTVAIRTNIRAKRIVNLMTDWGYRGDLAGSGD